ncbi:hypothetical protein [Pedobacter sp. UYP24]
MNDIWKLRDPRYKIMELKGDALQQEIAKMKRHEILEWLQWNDRNGIYTDEESMREFGNITSQEEGIEIMTRQIEEA